jgi:hypothetical protein
MRGFSRAELLLVVALIGGLTTVLLDRLRYYQEAAEKAGMEYTISALRSALRLRLSTLMLEGRAQEARLLARQNPMDWLERKPDNYAGAFTRPAPGSIAAGNWYFDSDKHTLVYLVKNGRYFQPGADGEKRVRLKLILVHTQPATAGAGTKDLPTDSVQLQIDIPYRWL